MSTTSVTKTVVSQVPQPPETLHPISQGYQKVKNELAVAHPLEVGEKNYDLKQEDLKLDLLRTTYGISFPMILEFERHIASKNQRLPPLQSNSISLDVLLGKDTTIGFEDYLHPPEYFEEEPSSRMIGEQLLSKSGNKKW
ncbi:Proteasome maturation protein [Oopsacas minuta]|uniref:Proteasome maturation protein n=1 Tax=Oopsacas minuta TaxID=111878 RepID=A0AAV7JXE4_9METZ|nr:Proteasome maturation protein [Oopsacas minuta]